MSILLVECNLIVWIILSRIGFRLSDTGAMTRVAPARIIHIHEASKFLGNCSSQLIDQAGETVQSPSVPFRVVPEFEFLRRWPSST